MAALCVVGRTAFALIPLPNFKPVSAHHHYHSGSLRTGDRIPHRSAGRIRQQLPVWTGTMDSVADVLLGMYRVCGGTAGKSRNIWPHRKRTATEEWKTKETHPPLYLRTGIRICLWVGDEPLLHHRLCQTPDLADRGSSLCIQLFLRSEPWYLHHAGAVLRGGSMDSEIITD